MMTLVYDPNRILILLGDIAASVGRDTELYCFMQHLSYGKYGSSSPSEEIDGLIEDIAEWLFMNNQLDGYVELYEL